MRTLPEYSTPKGIRCPECGELCKIIALDNAFDYAGTHCTGGRPGTHYPDNFGDPVSDCCEAPMRDEVMMNLDFDDVGLSLDADREMIGNDVDFELGDIGC